MRKNVTVIVLASATFLASVAGASALDRNAPARAEAKIAVLPKCYRI